MKVSIVRIALLISLFGAGCSSTPEEETSDEATVIQTTVTVPVPVEAELPPPPSNSLENWRRECRERYATLLGLLSQVEEARAERDNNLSIAADSSGERQETALQYARGWDERYTRLMAQYRSSHADYEAFLRTPPSATADEELPAPTAPDGDLEETPSEEPSPTPPPGDES